MLFKIVEILKSAEKFEKSNNFYFQNHICEDGENTKINFDYSIRNQINDEIAVFGYCEKCKTIFHNKDYLSDSL